MQITFELDDQIVESYLSHYNDCEGTDLTLETLTQEQAEGMAKEFGSAAEGELTMRTDDHDGFETELYWDGILD